ncbi:MAG: DUF92 domain-containing protein [Gemmatimonadota bacterium]
MPLPPPWVIGFVAATAIAIAARRLGWLTTGGALAAVALGTVAAGAGWGWAVVLIAYFVVASLLTRFRAGMKRERMEDRIEKPGARDAVQVLANGGLFGAAALVHWLTPGPMWMALGVGALATSSADTWATEIGALARAEARSIMGFHPVPTGTSGGVTIQGIVAALGGAGFVALVAWGVRWPLPVIVAAASGGFFGAVMDSVMGASVQARRHCRKCNVMTEQKEHRCGMPTDVTGGIHWIDNDDVNALATLYGALFGAAAATFI